MKTRMMICCRGWLIASLALLMTCAVSLGAPRERDVWYACVADGQRYGYRHTTVTALPDGNFRYTLESRVLCDLLGAKQELTHRVQYVVTPAYEPVSLRSEGSQVSGRSLVVGRVEGGRMMLTIERAGFKRSRTIDLSGKPIFDECLDDWLSDQPADIEDTTVNIFSLEFGVQPATLKRRISDRSESRWHFEWGNLERGIISYDADGIRREAEFTVPSEHTTRVSAAEARQIGYRKLSGRDLLMFPLGEGVTAKERLESLTVKLTWTNIPFDRFQFEDDRQRITQKSQTDGRFGVVLQIRPAKPLPVDTRYPVKGPEFEPYLAETHYVKPHDTEIAATARQWTQGKETVVEAVRSLSTEVCNHLAGGVIAVETLSGPEVLQSKQGGKCGEATTLFASLARSLGIPTRVVFGVRMEGGLSVAHVWCEVYAGRWITVDPLANEVGDSMALLKFSHSDSILGINILRWELTESLGISVDGFKMRPNALVGRFKTGISGRIYTNVDVACRFTVPSDNWSIRDKSQASVTMIRFNVPKRGDVQILLVASRLPAGIPLKTIVGAKRVGYKRTFNDFKMLKDDPYTINGISGHRLAYQHSSGKGKKEKKRTTTEVIWIRGTFCYGLILAAEESAHDKYSGDFYKLLASFEDLNEIASACGQNIEPNSK